jgi:spore maturation protein CgeB
MASSTMTRANDVWQNSTGAKKPRVLIVGSDHDAAIERYYSKHFAEEGVENYLFAAQGIFFSYYNASIINKVSFKLGFSKIYKRINEELLKKVAEMKPDVMLVFKGMEIFASTLKTIKETGIRLVNYNPDNPFLFSGKGSGNQNIYDSIPFYHLHVTYDEDIQQKLEKLGLNAARIPFGFELTKDQLESSRKEPEVLKLCFLGNPDVHRIEFLNIVAKAGLPIDVYGHNWKKFALDGSISVYQAVYGIEFWKVLRKYRIQLNLMRPHNLNSHNMRSFEVPAVGGIGLFPNTPDHRKFFLEGLEVVLYDKAEDCIQKANRLLALSTEEATTIRNNAYNRSVRSAYSYAHRAHQLVEEMQSLL